jgi:hypothetical protein
MCKNECEKKAREGEEHTEFISESVHCLSYIFKAKFQILN